MIFMRKRKGIIKEFFAQNGLKDTVLAKLAEVGVDVNWLLTGVKKELSDNSLPNSNNTQSNNSDGGDGMQLQGNGNKVTIKGDDLALQTAKKLAVIVYRIEQLEQTVNRIGEELREKKNNGKNSNSKGVT